MQQRARDHQLLLHPPRELARKRQSLVVQAGVGEYRFGTCRPVGHAIQPREQDEMVQGGQVVEQMRLVGHERQPPPRLERPLHEVEPSDCDASRCRRDDTGETA